MRSVGNSSTVLLVITSLHAAATLSYMGSPPVRSEGTLKNPRDQPMSSSSTRSWRPKPACVRAPPQRVNHRR
eukprot:8578-Eustigmatos_ZCMA.PRE.1